MTFQDSITFRRDLHELAELSGQEEKTSAYIKNKLEEAGFKVKDRVGGYGLVVDIDSGVAGPTIMLRADMDALPYADENDPEKMIAVHACGHDAHSAMLLAAASEIKNILKKGKVRLVFQPGEESLEGAISMIEDGVLEGVDIAVGAHIRPMQDLKFGTFCSAVNHVACATVEITIHGKQAHAARPHLGINPIEAASQFISTIGLIKVNPNKSWSVKPTQIHSENGATNSIPSFVKIAYDVRAQDNESLNFILEKLQKTAEAIEFSFGAKVTYEKTEFCPGPDYDPELVNLLNDVIVEQFGRDALGENCGGGGEDFHFYKLAKPEIKTAYFGLGSGAQPGLHNRNMTFDDSVLPLGSRIFAELVKKLAG